MDDSYQFNGFILYFIMFLVQFQLFFSGVLTTFTFTLMMEISFMAPKNIQASHFSLIATCEVFGKLLFQPLISFYTDTFGYTYAFILFVILYSICPINFKFKPKSILKMN
ncbi:unnamed protein product [Brachionus calyciflorus]|uniref:Uncharacterized protein n=1 Tax=Brachionus calyciflorus TaxID=104777 RepID=A0A813P9M1_9BILA|nr:unnamed protein product [Brachionus calyciflorus]